MTAADDLEPYMFEDGYQLEQGVARAMAGEYDRGHHAGYLDALADVMTGAVEVREWAGFAREDPTCEACEQTFPVSEYGFLLTDELWAQVAPRPAAGTFGSGVLCLDCIGQRLGREVTAGDIQALTHYGDQPTFRAARLLTEIEL